MTELVTLGDSTAQPISSLEDRDLKAASREDVGATETCEPCTNDPVESNA
jgi:hypothetical protein